MGRQLLVPEVIQASAMDCGPAALKSIRDGFGGRISYGRLREACQTDVDGTSIDTLEEIANQLGLDAEQVMVPPDHVLMNESELLPAIAVVSLPGGVTHFVVAWRKHGGVFQLMDPATGRRWPTASQFFAELYVHSMPVEAAKWREWAETAEFLRPVERQLAGSGVGPGAIGEMKKRALDDPGWRGLAALDATARMVAALTGSHGLTAGAAAADVARRFFGRCLDAQEGQEPVPEHYWSVRPVPAESGEPPQLRMRGAVLVRVRGKRNGEQALDGGAEKKLAPELVAALAEPPACPGRELLRFLRADGLFTPAALGFALTLASFAVMIEAILFRGLFDIGREIGLAGHRMAAMAAVLAFSGALFLLEFPIASGAIRMGRRMEARLRMAFLRKIPLLSDRYFQSRLTSDMAERSHAIHRIRHLPELGVQLLRVCFEMILTVGGIAWLDPGSTGAASAAAALAIAGPLLAQPVLGERDLRFRSHTGALCRFYLDSLLGLVAIRVHGAGRSVRREHEHLLMEWSRSGMSLQRAVVSIEGLQLMAGFGLAAWVLLDHLNRGGDTGSVLLLIYWALNLPVLGQEIAQLAWQYPVYRNLTLRLMEPLGALEEEAPSASAPAAEKPKAGAAISLKDVSVVTAGRTILEHLNLEIEPGSHVAVVGPSGAGKSSFAGLLLGWHRAASGAIAVDDAPLDRKKLGELRAATAWVDPSVQIWNRTLIENLRYGARRGAGADLTTVLSRAGLTGVLEKLPDGMQTRLGEGGGLLSGGEGQRVRLGRAISRPDTRLVILDEPFRGLDRDRRRKLLENAREFWRESTMLCITHDISETEGFDRVLVMENGRITADGRPRELAGDGGSRYSELLAAERKVREGMWSGPAWRRIKMMGGRLVESTEDAA
jgi:ATP-binding cassette subfamily B protein